MPVEANTILVRALAFAKVLVALRLSETLGRHWLPAECSVLGDRADAL